MHSLHRIIHNVSLSAASTNFIDVIHLKDVFINWGKSQLIGISINVGLFNQSQFY